MQLSQEGTGKMDEKKFAEIKRLVTIGVLLSPENAKELVREIERLRQKLSFIQEMASHEIRMGRADGTSLYQIEADAQAALENK